MRLRRATLPVLALAVAIAAACSGSSSSKTATPFSSTAPTGSVSQAGAGTGSSSAPSLKSDSAYSAVDIVKKLAPSVVRIQTEGATIDNFGRPVPAGGVGTGVILDGAGHIVTNNHVVTIGGGSPAQNITATLNDQRTATAKIVGRDEPTDLAVIQIDQSNLSPAAFGNSADLQVGQDVVAIGYALDLKGAPSVTKGVVSAIGRSIQEQPYTINDAIQTDAGINPGNSGGPLVDGNAEVIGINTAIIQGAQSIGFSISSDLVQPTVQALIANGKIDRAYLGVGTVDVTDAIARNFGLPANKGVAVTAVGPGSPAAQAGVQPNDVIVNVDGQDVANSGDLLAVLAEHKPGDRVGVTYYRGNDKRTTDVTLASRPNA